MGAVVVSGVVLLGLALPAQATLESRLGGLAYYDTDLNITWAANANINGFMNWSDANDWAAGLTLGGVSGWRLPTTTQPDGSCGSQGTFPGFVLQGYGTGCTGSEMGHLFYVEGISAAAPGVFINLQNAFYWSGTEFAPDTIFAWRIVFGSGEQLWSSKPNGLRAWAVHDGDVVLRVAIDIKPGDDSNTINVRSAGVVPVAILSSATFNALTVDPATISLAGASVKLVGKSAKALCHEEDVNGDMFVDLVCKIETVQFIIEEGATTAHLEGTSLGNKQIVGEDTIRIVPD